MSYATITIGNLLEEVNTRYFLSAIQRPYVWSADQVVTLMDSLMKGYPISSFMFWKVGDELKRELKIYQFVEHWQQDAQNPPASADGRDTVLVLDGQQRMTSLLIALRGTFAEKTKYQRRSNPKAWTAKTLYLNLLKDPDEELDEDDTELGISYGFRFHGSAPHNNHRNHWFRLGDILNYRTRAQLDELVQSTQDRLHHGVTQYERDLVSKTLSRLDRVIWMEEAVNCLVPVCDGLLICDDQKDALWDKFFTAAPRPRTRSEQQYSDRALRTRR